MRAWLWAWLFYARPASASFVPSDPLPFLYSSVSFQSCVFFDQLLEPVPGLRDGFADRMLFGAQIHLPRHILLAVACDKMRWNLGQKSRGLGGFLRTSTEAAAPSRPAQEQAFLGARHPYVAEPAFFLHQGRR